jgi:hypothetical protein
MPTCKECGAHYADDEDSCASRFDELLALDHSRQEPWGSRHGQAFAAYALQHPAIHARSLDSAWAELYRIYVLGEYPAAVIASMRAGRPATGVPPRPPHRIAPPKITIADLGDFGSETYSVRVDDWCKAALISWGASI